MQTVRFAADSAKPDQGSRSGSLSGELLEQPDPHGLLTPLEMFDFGGNGLNEPKLLDFSDEIRSHLLEDHSLGPWAETVKRVFRKLLRDEGAALPAVSFATIQNARLDKLLSDILTLGHQQVSSRLRPRLNIAIAERLQRSWMARFREEFFNIDQTRQEDLSKSSRLKDVVFNKKAANGWELWKAAKCKTVSGLEWNLQFKPGY